MFHLSLTTCVLAVVVPTEIDAHNWVNNPTSRTPGLSKERPCPARRGDSINFAVAQGQDFALEWSVGHPNSFTWFAIVSRGNEDKLPLHTEALLQEYLDDAPGTAKSSNPNGYTHGKSYEKLHTRWAAPGGKAGNTLPTAGVGDGRAYTKELTSSDATYFVRPDDWRCSRSTPRLSGGCKNPQVRYAQFEYLEAAHRSDLRAAYSSEKFPWLMAVAKYKIYYKRPQDHDLALLKFPDGSAYGEYVIQYLWRGYYDCFDIVLTSGTVPPILKTVAVWLKVDHCQYRPGMYYLLHRSKPWKSNHRCMVVPSNGNISECKQTCNTQGSGSTKCSAVNVVPLTNPDMVLFQDDVNIPFTTRSCIRNDLTAAASADSLVCYGLTPADPPEVGPPYTITDDPRDPVFYSTCYRKEMVQRIEGYHVDVVEKTAKPKWRFGDKCVSCEDAQRNLDVADDVVPTWKLATECKFCN